MTSLGRRLGRLEVIAALHEQHEQVTERLWLYGIKYLFDRWGFEGLAKLHKTPCTEEFEADIRSFLDRRAGIPDAQIEADKDWMRRWMIDHGVDPKEKHLRLKRDLVECGVLENMEASI